METDSLPVHVTAPRRVGCSAPLVAFLLTGVLTLVTAVYLLRDPLPRLDAESLEQARRHWQSAEVQGYRLQLQVEGDQSGEYLVEVRNGSPTSVTRDGREPPRRTWPYWTVDGLLDVLANYLEMQARAETGSRPPGCTRAILQVEFDPQAGYPRRFARHDLENGRVVRWEIRTFEPLRE